MHKNNKIEDALIDRFTFEEYILFSSWIIDQFEKSIESKIN
jgi:hypothetical protein